jgi:outer membrane protein insertion porin family
MKRVSANRLGWIRRVALLVISLCIPTQSQILVAQTAPPSEPTVVAMRIVKEDGTVLSDSPQGLPLGTGQPLGRKKLADCLRLLYRTGDYSDLKAVVTFQPGGVRLDFVVRENLFFNNVKILGIPSPPAEPTAVAAMQLNLGEPFRQTTIEAAKVRLLDLLHEEGLYSAVVEIEATPNPATDQVNIIARVKPGQRARIGTIQLKNNTSYREAEILSRAGIRSGGLVTSTRLQRWLDRIRKYLVTKGHLSARTSIRRGEYNAATNTVPLELEVTEGPRIQLTVTGAKFSAGTLKRLVPIYEEGSVDADLLEEGKRNLRDRLEREGYFDAEVEYTIQTLDEKIDGQGPQGTKQVIHYEVDRGVRHKFIGIEIIGNKYFDKQLLQSRLQIFASAFQSPGRFSRRLVEADAESMRLLYLANGFIEAKVQAKVEDDYNKNEGNVFVRFLVQEGKQTRVSSLSIEGNKTFKEEELLQVIGSSPGQPYSESNVTTDRDNILALYFNAGFPAANFRATVEPGAGPTDSSGSPLEKSSTAIGGSRLPPGQKSSKDLWNKGATVRLVYHIDEGPQTRVREILVSGYRHTRPAVIRREVRIKTQEPLRGGDVIESQRRLYNLGVFNRVTIEPQNPAGTNPEKDIVVLVEEAKRYTLAYGGGFEVQRLTSTTNPTGGQVQAAPRGILEISKLNLTGRGDALSLKIRGSTLQGRALLGYSVPNTFGNSHWGFQATAFAEKTRDINTFTAQRYEGSVQLSDQLNLRNTVMYRYSFRKVLVSNLNSSIPPEEIPLFEQPTLVSQFGMTWIRDTRDNPADATKGSFYSADISDTDTKFGSSASFLRLFFQNSTYYPIGRRYSFARSTRIGILDPYRDTISLSFPPTTTSPLPTVIPLPERFFAGGGTSLHGFALNQAGPRDAGTGFPVGGQALLILNQEFRFPMRLPLFGTALGGAIFYDAGNVYSRMTRISFRTSLPKPVIQLQNPALPPGPSNQPVCVANCSNELNYFSHTIGLGVRYKTPVGPVRVDFGYMLNRPYFVIPCTSGVSGCQQTTRLPAFQFFLNLGSTF